MKTKATFSFTRRWGSIIGHRAWASLSCEGNHAVLAAWHWLKYWSSLPANSRPGFGKACLSAALTVKTIIREVYSDGTFSAPALCIGSSIWGGLGANLVEVVTRGQHCPTVWRLGSDINWVHLTNPERWQVIPWEPVSPLKGARYGLGMNIRIAQSGEPVPLLKDLFSNKVTIPFSQLQKLATHLELNLRSNVSRRDLLMAIARHVNGNGDLVVSLDEKSTGTELKALWQEQKM